MKPLLKTENLDVQLNKKNILKDVNLTFDRGKIYGLLGPNGAGKTTLLKVLLGVFHPSAGIVTFQDEDLYNHSRRGLSKQIGSIIEYPGFYYNLTLKENMTLHMRYLKITPSSEYVESLLKEVGLFKQKDKLFSETSLGMKQRLGVARSLSHHPTLLLLDEPTNGLDPQGIKEVRDMLVKEVIQNKTTIIISSHLLNEVHLMADELIFMNHGEIIFETINVNEGDSSLYKVTTTSQINKELMDKLEAQRVLSQEDYTEFVSTLSYQEVEMILLQENIVINKLEVFGISLEDLYLKLLSGGGAYEFTN
ncbi:ABC-type multidrug transport system ATPase subunit [Salibacterium salarium]|uniref:ABC transporter ATP-binding protein n=1 Tax=Salibacterium salarium TaxID=284579 RepID=UPI00278722C4|nr:ABC transporter ATP-binding protein [Salibacterium salarium]MDQ0300262.1 ABC-type multidrug transport system ATPase subunit [Salibacterium salarium]